MKINKIIKIILGVIIFFTLPTLLLFGFAYFKYNEDLPHGVQSEQANALAYKMLESLNYKAYQNTNYIEWTFNKRHHYQWKKNEKICTVFWKNYKVSLDLNDHSQSQVYLNDIKLDGQTAVKLIEKGLNYFNNDSFWLVAPYKVFDKGTERRLVTLPNNEKGLLITYKTGGSTPGDSYLWLLDKYAKPIAFKMWTSILPIDGLKASWSHWTTTKNGTQLPTFHKLLFLGIEIDIVRVEN